MVKKYIQKGSQVFEYDMDNGFEARMFFRDLENGFEEIKNGK